MKKKSKKWLTSDIQLLEQSLVDAQQKTRTSDTILLGTTTLERMLNAVYGDNDTPYDCFYSECGCAQMHFEEYPSFGETVVYVYYHRKKNETIMTTIKDDILGLAGSSAGFKGKVML